MANIYNSIYSIQLDIQCNCALIKVNGYITSAEFRSINEQILEFMVKYNLKKNIHEIHALAVPYPSDRKWYIENYLPRVIKAGIRYAAVIVPKNMLARLVVEDIIEAIKPDEIEVRTFHDLSLAREWLLELKG